VIDRVVDDLARLAALAGGYGDRALSRRRDERGRREFLVADVMAQAGAFQPRGRQHDRVVLDVGLALHCAALDLREGVEPLLDRAVERLGVVVAVCLTVTLLGVEAAFVFALQPRREELLDPGVDIATQGFDTEVGPGGEKLCAPAEAGSADHCTGIEVGESPTVGSHEEVGRRGSLGDAGDDQLRGRVGGHVLHRVDGAVDLARKDFFVEAPDERARLSQAVDQLVADLVAPGLDLDQFDLVAPRFQGLRNRGGLAAGEIRAPGGEPDGPARAHGRSRSPTEKSPPG